MTSPFCRKSSLKAPIHLALGVIAAQCGVGGALPVDAWAQETVVGAPENRALQTATETQVKALWIKLQADSVELEATDPRAAITRYQGFFEQGAGRFPAVGVQIGLRIARIWQLDLKDYDKAIEIYDWALGLYRNQPEGAQLQQGRLAAEQAQDRAEAARGKKGSLSPKVPGLMVPVPQSGGGKLGVSLPSTRSPKLAPLTVPQLAPRGNALGWQPGPQRCVTALAQGADGMLWVATEDAGVWRYDASVARAQERWQQFLSKDGLGDDSAYALVVDKQGRVWAGTLNHGVSVWNGKEWKNYGVLDGPLGERVFDIAVCPTDGDVWIATNAGLTRYSAAKDTWSYVTRADGLPSDQVQAIAFDKSGNIVLGTQCDGVALAGAADSYKKWRVVNGPEKMPLTATGKGLPSSLINDVLVAADGTIYAATTTGLAWSSDKGEIWSYVRGQDYAAKVQGLYGGAPAGWREQAGAVLGEDYVSCLAQDEAGRIWVGLRRSGSEMVQMQSGTAGSTIKEVSYRQESGFVKAMLPRAQGALLLARYDQGLSYESAAVENDGVPKASTVATPVSLPSVAKSPSFQELQSLLNRVSSLKQPLEVGMGAYLGEDWMTGGDWVGRYGRRYAALFATQSPASDEFIGDQYYSVDGNIGPNATSGDMLRSWIHWFKSDNSKVLYNPHLGYRREAEWDDHGEAYPKTHEGPDIWVSVDVPEGYHRLSLYFFNKDGHSDDNRLRDYLVELKGGTEPSKNLFYSTLNEFPGSNPSPPDTRSLKERYDAMLKANREEAVSLENSDMPTLARTRVRDFWGPVYKQFLVCGPRRFYVKVSKNNSFNTILQSVMLDSMGGPQTRFEGRTLTQGKFMVKSFPQRFDPYHLDGLGEVQYHPVVSEAPLVKGDGEPSPEVEEARKLWSELEQAYAKQGSAALQWPYRLAAYRSLVNSWSLAQPGVTPAMLASWRWRLKLWAPEDRNTFQEVMNQGYKSYIADQEAKKGKVITIRSTPDGSSVVNYEELSPELKAALAASAAQYKAPYNTTMQP